MIGMGFGAFAVLLIAGLVASFVVHYVIRYRFFEGFDGFLGKWTIAWIGAWLGSPVLGHWFEPLKVENVYLVPALLGALAGAFFVTVTGKALAKAFGHEVATITEKRRAA